MSFRLRTIPLGENCAAIGKMNVIAAEVLPIALRTCNPVKKFYRVLVGQTVLYSAEYRRMSVWNIFTVNYKQDNFVKFGQIQYFLYFSSQILAVIIPLRCENCTAHFGLTRGALDSLPTSQILRVISRGSLCTISVYSVIGKCVLMNFTHGTYIASVPNSLDLDYRVCLIFVSLAAAVHSVLLLHTCKKKRKGGCGSASSPLILQPSFPGKHIIVCRSGKLFCHYCSIHI